MAARSQRRAAAAMVVSSILPGGGNPGGGGGKKSTAQPRPTLHVAPKGIGPIADPNKNDVLSGRGGRINAHEGNVQFRDIVNGHKKIYLAKTTKKLEKAHIAAKIVEQIRSMDPPGRFLKEDAGTGLWWDIGDAKAIKKVGQALREDAQEVRKEEDEDDVGSPAVPDDKKKAPPQPKRSPAASRSPASSTMPPPGTKPGPKYSSQHVVQNIYNMPGNLYKGARQMGNKTTTLSEQALKAMTAQQPPSNVAFGRNFTPTEISGASMSTISGMSGATSANMDTGSNVYGTTNSALSMNSWGVGSLGMGSVSSMRSSNFTGGSAQRHALQRHSANHRVVDPRSNKFAPRVRSSGTGGSGGGGGNASSDVGVSDLTYNYMNSSGMQRSPSFGELSSATANNQVMSDDSLVALLTEQKAVDDAVAQQRAVDQALLAAGGGTVGNSDQWSRITASDLRTSGRAGSGMSMGQQQRQQAGMMPSISDNMSVASGRSMMSSSILTAGDDASWAMQQSFMRQQQQQQQQQQLQQQRQQQMRNDPWENQSMISDISDTVLALDLAGPKD